MKTIKVVEIKKLYSLMFDARHDSDGDINACGNINKSLSVVEIYDEETRKTHFAQWRGVTNTLDLLPNGSLYLADDFNEAVVKLEKIYA